jgi:hypothetical protein
MKRLLFLFVVVALSGSPLITTFAATFGPTPYLSAADSPFTGLPFGFFHLENFEDGLLNTPGVFVNAGAIVVGPGVSIDSVDADDGAIDGFGQAGLSLYSNNGGASLSNFTFTFDAGVLGGLPTHAGVVWTDVGFALAGDNFGGPVSAEAFDSANLSIGTIGPVFLGGDGTVDGATAEDRFFGFSNVSGISRLVISMSNSTDWEVDHLQYGLLVPEPASVVLVIGMLVGAVVWRRRRAL